MKSKQFLVLGLGRFGASLAKTLCELGQEVLAVDADEDLVGDIAPHVTQAMQLDATDETLLASLGVKNFDAAIVSIGQNTRDSILVCVLLKELGVPYLVAKANDDLHAKVLRKIGADRVIVLSNGAVVADGAPKQVFSQVDLLKKEGLTAPVTVRLLHALRAHGMDVPLDALTVSDCADAVAAALNK